MRFTSGLFSMIIAIFLEDRTYTTEMLIGYKSWYSIHIMNVSKAFIFLHLLPLINIVISIIFYG